MGNRKRSAERLQAFKDKIRSMNAVGSTARMDLFNDMFFDISFRLSKSCGMQDAIGDTEIFRIEYQRYCMYLSSGLSEFVILQLNSDALHEVSECGEVLPTAQSEPDFESVSLPSLDTDSSFCSFQDSVPGEDCVIGESCGPAEVVPLPILQPIVTLSEDQIVQGRGSVVEGVITGFINSDLFPSFNVSELAIRAEIEDRKRSTIAQAPDLLAVLSLCEPYMDCRTRIALKLAYPSVNIRRPQCRDRAIVAPLMDPYALKIKGAQEAFPGSRMHNLKYLESKSHIAERSTRCLCSFPWTLSLFTEEMSLTREIVRQLGLRFKHSVPKMKINIFSVTAPVCVASISRKLGEYGNPSFMISMTEQAILRSGNYAILDKSSRQRTVAQTEALVLRRMSV